MTTYSMWQMPMTCRGQDGKSVWAQVFTILFPACLCLLPVKAHPGEPPGLEVCVDYHCDNTVMVRMESRQWRTISRMFSGQTHPGLERALIARAIALFEQFVGEQAGTSGDLAKNRADGGLSGQLDCIAESTNTTTYLTALENAGLLRWHSVEDPARRAAWIFDVHWTAVIRDVSTFEEFAVDSWFLANGRAPYVQALTEWIDKRPLPENPDSELTGGG